MAGSLKGPAAKLLRAQGQLGVLKSQIDALWHPAKAWPTRAEVDRGGLEHRFYLRDPLPRIDTAWSLHAGEILFDLRSALDHLVWEMHVRHYRGGPIPEEVEFGSQFPIYDSPARYKRKGAWRLRNLAKRDQRAIELLQPYVRRDDKWVWARSDLRNLNTLHNIDKHRQLHLVAGARAAVEVVSFPAEYGFRQRPHWGSAEADTPIETWTFSKVPTKVQDHGGAFLDVTLEHGDGLPMKLVESLDEMIESVGLVLARFANRFPPLPHGWHLPLPPSSAAYTANDQL